MKGQSKRPSEGCDTQSVEIASNDSAMAQPGTQELRLPNVRFLKLLLLEASKKIYLQCSKLC